MAYDWSGGSGTLDATCNWYGTTIPVDVAAEINSVVTYIPWLTSGTDSAPLTTGFQTTESCAACDVMVSATHTDTHCGPTTGDIDMTATGGTGVYAADRYRS